MMKNINLIFDTIFSKYSRGKFEKFILILAALGFITHLMLIFLNSNGYIQLDVGDNLLKNPISALYTPFSFILVYEAFLLIYYLPSSFTVSVVKGYEIISLVLIRKIFKDVPQVDLSQDFFANPYNVQFIYDIVGFVLVFFLIYLFKTTAGRPKKPKIDKKLEKFISQKKAISILLVPVLLALASYSFYNWLGSLFIEYSDDIDVNFLFFVDFFTILILVDVLLLLISFRYTERYSQLIRNTGFIISTIMLRLSFTATGLASVSFLVLGILFGVVILAIFKKMEKVNYLG
ncbi:MAG: hypothetical protein VXY09_03830 [Bacteroidota bacterium]|nr:hypothetical protein [Bacteroidota bacterium]